MAQPAAPSAMTRARSAVRRMASATSSSETTNEPATQAESSGHMVGRTDLPPAPSTKDACQSGNQLGSPFSNDSASGAAVAGSAA